MKWLIIWLIATALWASGWLILVDQIPDLFGPHFWPVVLIQLGAVGFYCLGIEQGRS
jgi:hypothetical protein